MPLAPSVAALAKLTQPAPKHPLLAPTTVSWASAAAGSAATATTTAGTALRMMRERRDIGAVSREGGARPRTVAGPQRGPGSAGGCSQDVTDITIWQCCPCPTGLLLPRNDLR